jgi:hypothetical protein
LNEEHTPATNVPVVERSSVSASSPPPPSSASPPSSLSPQPPRPQRPAVAEDERAQTRKTLVREIKRIDAWTNNLIDSGLFDKGHKKLFGKKQKEDEVRAIMDGVFKDIQDNLYTARKSLENDDLPASDYYVAQALRAYEKALYAPSRAWRFSNVYAGPMWIYLVGFLISVLVFYWYQLDENFLNLHVHIQEAALHATTWGTVGAILRGLWFLKDKVSDRRYRNSFRIYLISTPFLGGLFGAIFYFMIVAGLFIIVPAQAPALLANQTIISEPNATTTTATTPQTESIPANRTSPENVSTLAIIPLAALAGFNWEWAIMILKRIGESFKGEMEPEDKIDR